MQFRNKNLRTSLENGRFADEKNDSGLYSENFNTSRSLVHSWDKRNLQLNALLQISSYDYRLQKKY